MFDLMKLVPANKFGDAYELEKSYEATGPQVPVVIPARARTIFISIVPIDGDIEAVCEVTYSSMNRVDAGEAVWHNHCKASMQSTSTLLIEVKPCQAVRLNITKGHCKMEIYAS